MIVKVLQAANLRTKSLPQGAACAYSIANACARWSRAADAVTAAEQRKGAWCPVHWSCSTTHLAPVAAGIFSCKADLSSTDTGWPTANAYHEQRTFFPHHKITVECSDCVRVQREQLDQSFGEASQRNWLQTIQIEDPASGWRNDKRHSSSTIESPIACYSILGGCLRKTLSDKL